MTYDSSATHFYPTEGHILKMSTFENMPQRLVVQAYDVISCIYRTLVENFVSKINKYLNELPTSQSSVSVRASLCYGITEKYTYIIFNIHTLYIENIQTLENVSNNVLN